eukprot:GEMP01037772.1.p1 GENE.GEMP01037772.1~~GEMP01037772.1.p1  ORF type:complete len:487 (+),score=136.53 GEMP01037772.1:144-1604(+)
MMDDSGYGFDELRDLVAAQHDGVELVFLPILERCLQASVAFPIGSIVLQETPLAIGQLDGLHAHKVLREDVAALEEEAAVFIDCILSMLLRYASEDDRETRKQMATLCRTATPVTLESAAELYSWLREEFQECISLEMLCNLINLARSNNFQASPDMTILFIGSMFEHSCAPNIFAGDVGDVMLRNFRTARDIAPGDRLSIDYLTLPRTYSPTAYRRAELLEWGFHCSCARCENPEDRVRCFACPQCSEEVYAGTWRCKCGFVADDTQIDLYAAAEMQFEEELNSGETWRRVVASPSPLHRWHYLVFHDAWAERACCEDKGAPVDLLLYLLEAISWFHADDDGLHPEMIHVAHELAERALKQADDEIWRLLGMQACPPPPELVACVGAPPVPTVPHDAPPMPSTVPTYDAATRSVSTTWATAAVKCSAGFPFVPAARVAAPTRGGSVRHHCVAEDALAEGTHLSCGREASKPVVTQQSVEQLEEMD